MSCEICGRGSCTRSFHSIEAQEEFDERQSMSDDVGTLREELQSARAELAALRIRAEQAEAELQEIASVLPGVAYMDPPDGGSPSIPEQFRRMRADLDRTAAERDALRAENALLRRVRRAAETLYQEAEEYDFDDGMGQGAPQDYWDALADAFDAMEEDKEE